MSSTFYRKYRPQIFADVVGQRHIVTTLTNALKFDRVGQAYLFTGPRGTGKTTLARLFAKAINCEKRAPGSAEPCGHCGHCLLFAEGRTLDVIEIDAASHTGVDNIRELRETLKLPPTHGSHKIYIIDEVHMLSIGAFNALLKTLEEPPAHVVFILATTALHKVPDTIVSRCQRFDLARFPVKLIVEKLLKIAQQEQLPIDRAALMIIAQSAEGGMRDAESLLMQIATLDISPITEDAVVEILGTTKKENLVALLSLIGENALYPSLSFIRTLSQDGTDLALFGSALLHYLRDLLLVSADPKNGPALLDLSEEEQTALLKLAGLFTPEKIVSMLEYFQVAQVTTKTAVVPELPLEIALVKILTQDNKEGGDETSAPLTASGAKKSTAPQAPTPPRPSAAKAIAKPAAPAPSHPDPLSSPATVEISLTEVRERWSAILETAKHLNASLSLALSTARPIEMSGSTVVIAVKYPFHQERLEEKGNRLTLEKAFDTILAAKMKIVIVLDTVKNEVTSTQENPLINQALSLLGGRVVTEN